MKKILLILFLTIYSFANTQNDSLKKMIGRMIILGFEGQSLSQNNNLKEDIRKYNLGGVILFDKYHKSKKKKNIKNPKQLKKLITDIQNISNYKMFISIDQEGGLVSRLNKNNGFSKTYKASTVSRKGTAFARKIYKKIAIELSNAGINLNFSPVVDLAVNPQNKVIVRVGRSYSSNPKEVIKYAKLFIDEMNNKRIISVLKHFPGHGSSLSDSHEGFVDISKTWNKKELIPYQKLIKSNYANMIMTAHVYNKNLDSKYPATLSKNINTYLLKEKLKYKGLIISDDLQMKAITKHYTLKQTVTLAINSGVNILLFGNQIDNKTIKLETIVNTIYEEVKNGNIQLSQILDSNKIIKNIF